MNSALAWRDGVLRVETCAGSWLLDVRRQQYCRAERGTTAWFVSPLAWMPFHRLTVGRDGHVRLALDPDGVSFVSGWLHTAECARCCQETTAQGLRRPA
ncbi:MAG TPA: hypothetical protein VGF22_23530 [Acidimicrobiales bacterium]|jgi:hypothetical protein